MVFFTKDLILSSEKENIEDYEELLCNLVDSLGPCNQMENLLVEKIAVVFWRLRRTIRFETGSIAKCIKSLPEEFYSGGHKDNNKIDKEIHEIKSRLQWNLVYIQCLSKKEVTFDKPTWEEPDISSDIVNDFYML